MQLDFNDFIVPEFDIYQIFTFGENMYNISTDDEKNPNYLAHSYKIISKKTVDLFDKNKTRFVKIFLFESFSSSFGLIYSFV